MSTSSTPAPNPAAAPADGLIALGGGRKLAFRTFGRPEGTPLLTLHGTPGSRFLFSVTHDIACTLGLRIVAPDRWGYAGTSPHPYPTLAGFAADIQQLADALRLESFAVMGISGGGPYAAAIASLLPDRVSALALVSPVGPLAVTPAPAMTPFHRFCFGPLARNPAAVAVVFTGFHRLLAASPRLAIRVGNALTPPADRRIIADGAVSDRLAFAFREGLAPGATGPATDLSLFTRPWNLPLADIRAPSRLWLGTADRNVPLSAARALATAIKGCHLQELPDQGHLWVALNYGDVLRWVAATAGEK